MKPETRFRKNQVIPFLKKLTYTSYFPISQISIKGDPDFMLCSSGRFVWLELKDTDEKLRKLQAYKADWVEKTGGIALRASPDNWDDIQYILKRLDGGKYDSV